VRIEINGRSKALSNHIVREAMRFYARKLITVRRLKNINVHLRFTEKAAKFRAEMWPRKRRNRFTISCSPLTGPYQVLNDLAHEMIHVEQYLSGAMQETGKGTAWNGRVYTGDFMKQNDAYWNAPWEINAAGRTYWLYKQCRLYLKKEGYRLHK
jgi:hypothetical protein